MAVVFTRKNIRLRSERYFGRQLYFLTLCFYERRHVGSHPRFAAWLIRRMRSHAQTSGFLLHAYCVMPDHLHMLVQGANDASDLRAFVESFKQDTGFRFQASARRRLWQFKYYDHIVRRADSADRIAWYIWTNPPRQGLCRTHRDHPFSGSFTDAGMEMFLGPATESWTPPWKTLASP